MQILWINCQSSQRGTLRMLRSLQCESRAAFTSRSLELGELIISLTIDYQDIILIGNYWPGDQNHWQLIWLDSRSSGKCIVWNDQAGVCASCLTSSTITGNPPVCNILGNCPTTPEHCQVCCRKISRTFLNITCSTVNMGVKLDLKKIALHARNAEYNPKRFAAVIMRIRWADHNLPPRDHQSLFIESKREKLMTWVIREPRTTALIFSSGKMVCTGAKSEEDSR